MTTTIPADSPPSDPDDAETAGLRQLRSATAFGGGISSLLGLVPEVLEVGHVSFSLTPRADFANPMGTVHGGIIATLLDSVVSCAVHSELGDGVSYTTVDLNVHYVRAARLDDVRLVADGRTEHVGRRLATATGSVVTADGKLIAHGSATCIILPSAPPGS